MNTNGLGARNNKYKTLISALGYLWKNQNSSIKWFHKNYKIIFALKDLFLQRRPFISLISNYVVLYLKRTTIADMTVYFLLYLKRTTIAVIFCSISRENYCGHDGLFSAVSQENYYCGHDGLFSALSQENYFNGALLAETT